MRVPTARVKSPTGGFVTINVSDLANHHELYAEQAPAFVDPRIAAPMAVALDAGDPVTLAGAALVERTMAARYDMPLDSYRELPAAERLAHVQAAAAEFDDAMAERSAERARQLDEAEREQAADDGAHGDRVEKGPRGLWYVMRGEERLRPGYVTEAEALQAIAPAN